MGNPEDEGDGRLTGMCTECGGVFWIDEGHSCSGRR